MPPLEVPASVPEPFGSELRAALAELPSVEHAWLLRAGSAWTAGVALDPKAPLVEFDAVRNRLHALAPAGALDTPRHCSGRGLQ
jgi:hypothetical protein